MIIDQVAAQYPPTNEGYKQYKEDIENRYAKLEQELEQVNDREKEECEESVNIPGVREDHPLHRFIVETPEYRWEYMHRDGVRGPLDRDEFMSVSREPFERQLESWVDLLEKQTHYLRGWLKWRNGQSAQMELAEVQTEYMLMRLAWQSVKRAASPARLLSAKRHLAAFLEAYTHLKDQTRNPELIEALADQLRAWWIEFGQQPEREVPDDGRMEA